MKSFLKIFENGSNQSDSNNIVNKSKSQQLVNNINNGDSNSQGFLKNVSSISIDTANLFNALQSNYRGIL